MIRPLSRQIFLDVGVEHQQRNGQRHDIAPDYVIGWCGSRNNVEVGEDHGDDQANNGAGDLGCPCVGLLQIDTECCDADED